MTTTQTWIPADTFGTRLFILRKQKGMTVEAIARLCGVAHPTWTTWENGAQPRRLVEAVQKISDATGVDRDWLMWGGPLGNRESRSTIAEYVGGSVCDPALTLPWLAAQHELAA